MKTQTRKSSSQSRAISSAGLALAAALAPTVANATTITLDPAVQTVGLGGSFDLAIRVAGLGDHTAPSLGAFDLDVNFDAALAHFDSISFGDPALGDLLSPATPSVNGSLLNVAGDSLNLFAVALDSSADLAGAQPGQFTIATLHFTALGLGTSGFGLANVLLGDGDGSALTVDGVQGASVTIGTQSVPEGNLGWVGAFALGAVALGHRRTSGRSRPA